MLTTLMIRRFFHCYLKGIGARTHLVSAVGLPKGFMFVGLEQGLGVHLFDVVGTLQPAHRWIADFYILSELESKGRSNSFLLGRETT